MSGFPVTEVALSGFHLIRRRSGDIAAWTLLRLMANFAMGILLILIGAERLSQLQALQQPDVDLSFVDMGRALLTAWPVLIVLLPLRSVIEAVLYGALFRAFLRPRDPGVKHMRLGSDELRLIAVSLAWTVLFMGGFFLVTFVAGMLAFLVEDALRPAAAMTGLVLFAGVLGVMSFAAVRLSLAWPSTFDHRRIEVFKSWTLTKGHFWQISAAYFLAFAITIVAALALIIAYAIVMLFLAVGVGMGLDSVGELMRAETSSVAGYFTLGMLTSLTLEAVISTLATVLLLTPVAETYRLLAKGAVPAPAEARLASA